MATPAKTANRRPRRTPARAAAVVGDESLRSYSLHFRVTREVADALEKAATTERRKASAWVAICVEDRLRSAGYLT
jgi:hypothetical protein